jgi:hypothetical protein
VSKPLPASVQGRYRNAPGDRQRLSAARLRDGPRGSSGTNRQTENPPGLPNLRNNQRAKPLPLSSRYRPTIRSLCHRPAPCTLHSGVPEVRARGARDPSNW